MKDRLNDELWDAFKIWGFKNIEIQKEFDEKFKELIKNKDWEN